MGARRRIEPVDAVVAGALGLAALAEIWAPDLIPGAADIVGSRWVLSATVIGMTLPLAWRRSLPLVACAAVLLCAAAQPLLTTPNEGLTSLAAMLLASYSVSAHGDRRAASLGLALVLVASAAVGAKDDFVFVLLLLVPAWSVGFLVNRRSHQVAALRTDRDLLLAERQAAAARGAEEERRRIARELHDVVAHRVSMMVVQAQSADALLAESPDRARAAILAVEGAGRDALTELRSLLGLLRSRSDGETPLAPLPGYAEIAALVEQARSTGVPIDLAVTGTPVAVGEIVGAAAYRVVQEAITNVIKHAALAATRVQLDFGPACLEVVVSNEGPSQEGVEPGFGLAGMRERVDFAGGSLDAGPAPGGGFVVHARLPLVSSSGSPT